MDDPFSASLDYPKPNKWLLVGGSGPTKNWDLIWRVVASSDSFNDRLCFDSRTVDDVDRTAPLSQGPTEVNPMSLDLMNFNVTSLDLIDIALNMFLISCSWRFPAWWAMGPVVLAGDPGQGVLLRTMTPARWPWALPADLPLHQKLVLEHSRTLPRNMVLVFILSLASPSKASRPQPS